MTVANNSEEDPANHLLPKRIHFPQENLTFERLQPMTDLRRDLDEARVLYSCRKVNNIDDDEQTYIMKIKIQGPRSDGSGEPTIGPSETTARELEALKLFKEKDLFFVPHFVAWTVQTQGDTGLLPGGFISYTIMTKMPGCNIMDLKFWSMETHEQQKIREVFLIQLKHIWSLSIFPYDTALRNILWHPETQKCSVIDFEHWERKDPMNAPTSPGEIEKELQRWGIVRRPPPATWADEWMRSGG